MLLVQHKKQIGGMLTNGLMHWDALYGGPRTPVFNEYAKMIEDHYRETYGKVQNSTVWPATRKRIIR